MSGIFRAWQGLDQFGEPHRELDALADRLGVPRRRSGDFAGLFQTGEQNFHVLAQQPLPERGIGARAGKLLFGHWCKFIHAKAARNGWRRLPRSVGLEAL